MQGSLDGVRRLSGGRVPKWSPALPRAAHFKPRASRCARRGGARSSIFRAAPRARWARSAATTPKRCLSVAERLFRKAGFDVVYPEGLAELCCGQPFESKGLLDGGRPQVGGAGARVARGQRQRALADRVRHESVRLPDAALLRDAASRCRTASSSSTIRCCRASRSRLVASRSSSIRCAACARWARSTSWRPSPGAAAAKSSRSTTCCAAASRATRASTVRSSTSTRCGT